MRTVLTWLSHEYAFPVHQCIMELSTYSQSLHQRCISQTSLGAAQRILLVREGACTSRLVAVEQSALHSHCLIAQGHSLNTNDLESVSSLAVDKVLPIDFDWDHC